MNSNKISLTEATILALQGKLDLKEDKQLKKEDIEVETDDIEVTLGDDKTIIDSDEATITIEKNTETSDESSESSDDETEEIESSEESSEPTVEEIVDEVPLDESKECTKIEEESSEDKYIEEISKKFGRELTDEEIRLIKTIAPIIEADAEVHKTKKTEANEDLSEQLIDMCESEVVSWETIAREFISEASKEDIEYIFRILELKPIDEDEDDIIDESKKVVENNKFSSKTFNKVIENFLKENKQNIESFKLNKLLKNESKIKIEGVIKSADKKEENVCFELKSIQQGKRYTKYELIENKSVKLESKSDNTKTSMVTFLNKDNILECKYMINK